MFWVIGDQQTMLRRKRELTLGDVIEVVAQFSHDETETTRVVVDLIDRGMVKLQGPRGRARVVRANR